MSFGANTELAVGSRVLSNRGYATVARLERHGVLLTYSLGQEQFVPFDRLEAMRVEGLEGVHIHPSLRPWFDALTSEPRAICLFRQEVVLEVLTGYRDGHDGLARDGEPFSPFGPDSGLSLAKRVAAMATQITHEMQQSRNHEPGSEWGTELRISIDTHDLQMDT